MKHIEWVLLSIGNIWQEFEIWQAARTLDGLDDRVLNDMGIPRGGIEDAVRGGRSAAAANQN